MNSNLEKLGNPQRGSISFNNYEFDLGLGSGLSNNRPRSLNDQKLQQQRNSSPYSFPSPSSSTSFSATQSKPASSSWSSTKASWTHQPSPAFAAGSAARLGITEKDPNFFGDLVGSALGKTSSSNVPWKNAAPAAAAATRNSFSTGNLADSQPQPSTSTTTTPMQRCRLLNQKHRMSDLELS